MKILTLLGFLVLLTITPMTNCFPGLFNAVPAPIYAYQPVAGHNFGLLALSIIVFKILLRPSPTTLTTTPIPPACPSGYTLNETVCGQLCYRLESRICRSFENARAACRAEGTDLLVPDACSYPLFRRLATQAAELCGDYWIGAFRIPPAVNYVRVRGLAFPDNFEFWEFGELSMKVIEGRPQACVQIADETRYLLNDYVCSDKIGYICQKFI